MEEVRVETTGIIFLVVIFIIILTVSDLQKKKHYNSFTEVLDGDVLSYECQRTGIVIDTKQRTIRFFDKEETRHIPMTISERSIIRFQRVVSFTTMEH